MKFDLNFSRVPDNMEIRFWFGVARCCVVWPHLLFSIQMSSIHISLSFSVRLHICIYRFDPYKYVESRKEKQLNNLPRVRSNIQTKRQIHYHSTHIGYHLLVKILIFFCKNDTKCHISTFFGCSRFVEKTVRGIEKKHFGLGWFFA